MSVKVARIERSIEDLRSRIGYYETLIDNERIEQSTLHMALRRLRMQLVRAVQSLEVTRLLEAPRVDPLQTDLEKLPPVGEAGRRGAGHNLKPRT